MPNKSQLKRRAYYLGPALAEVKMTTAAVVKSGNDLVHQGTGEVIGEAFSMPDYLTSITTKASLDHQQKLAAAYDAACASLIGPNDVQKDGARTFKKKSAWRKLARHFGISTSVVSVDHRQAGEHYVATVTVKASAPWGQSAEAAGACGGDEATGRRTITISDAIATAETRATNRAVSNLIAMGEVSAEEMDKRTNGAPKAPAEMVMPIGKQKGKKLGEIDSDSLIAIVEWCKEKQKFPDLIEACVAVVAARSIGGPDSENENSGEEPY